MKVLWNEKRPIFPNLLQNIHPGLKDAVIAVPFKLRPENVSSTLAQDFQYQNGILFRRFAIPADSFNGTVFKDHCSIRGCSHKCNYDYDREDYICTCPKLLVLGDNGRTCQTPNDGDNEITDETTDSKSFEGEITSLQVLTSTEKDSEIGNRIGKVNDGEESAVTLVSVPLPNLPSDPTTESIDDVTITTTAANVSDYDTTTPGSEPGDETGDVTSSETVNRDDVTTSRGAGGEDLSTSPPATDVITTDRDITDPVTEDQTDAAENNLEHTTDNKELTTSNAFIHTDVTGVDTLITTDGNEETTTSFSLTDDETSPIRNIRQDVVSLPATKEPGAAKEESTTEATSLVTETDDITSQEPTTVAAPADTSTLEELSQETTTVLEDLTDALMESEEATTTSQDTTQGLEESLNESKEDLDEFDKNSEESEDMIEETDVFTTLPLIIEDDENTNDITTSLPVATTPVFDKTTIRVIKIKSEKPTTTQSPGQEPVTEMISMEVMDDKNAVITVPGMYTIKCNVTETKDLEVTLQRTAAFSFPIRANNSLDFDGIDLSCRETGGRQRGVHLIIDKARVRGDISRIWEDNVRLIVDSLLIEDISPE